MSRLHRFVDGEETLSAPLTSQPQFGLALLQVCGALVLGPHLERFGMERWSGIHRVVSPRAELHIRVVSGGAQLHHIDRLSYRM
ncbi:1743_t:CDS:2 [Ambispora gerdemannii]|uniref:1743_t:CDS:1 n=1 Tax=Ambispora gerdemannii TaxID=144530 RepID=A0A9N9FMJ3_9GLOM|nr:1743_t:CDS:2 [Ambispora gerdemannii]